MGVFSKDIQSLNDLFVHQLQDVLYAENRILKALPDMIQKASSPDLKSGLQNHMEETRHHVERLHDVFMMYNADEKTVKCPAIDGIINEADEVSGETGNDGVLDAAIISSAQAVEHYEIARYGTLVAWAKQLGRSDCANILQETLDEEKSADMKLSELASEHVNMAA